MNEQQKRLIEQFQANQKTINETLAKPDYSGDDNAAVEKLLGDNEVLRSQLVAIQDNIRKAGELDAFLNNPAYVLPKHGNPTRPGAQLLGVTPSGSVGLTSAKGDIQVDDMDPEGSGMTEKQWAAIHEPEYKRAYGRFLRNRLGVHALTPTDLKTLQEGLDDSGGVLVPADTLNKIIQKQAAPTRLYSRVTKVNTSKDRLHLPKVVYATDNIYTTGMRVTWTGEVPASSTAHRVTEPVFGQAEVPVYTAMMSLPMTLDLMEDNAFGLEQWISGKFVETVDLLRDYTIISGTGVNQPRGIDPYINTTNGVEQVLSGAANDIAAATLRSLPFKVPEQYINDNTCWIANRPSFGASVAELREGSGTGQFLFATGMPYPGIAGRTPDTIAGYPVCWSAFVDDIGDGNHPALFGDPMGYVVVNRVGFSVRILDQVYAETNQIVVLGRLRFGGDCLEPFRLRAYKSDNA